MKDKIKDWLEYKRERGEKYKPRGLAALYAKFEKMGCFRTGDAIDNSMACGYQGIVEPRGAKTSGSPGIVLNSMGGIANWREVWK